MIPDKIQKLVELLAMFPGVGEKTAQKYAFTLLSTPEERLTELITSLQDLKSFYRCCVCNFISEQEMCNICSDPTRDPRIICVLSELQDVLKFQKLHNFHGRFFILNGLISIHKGKMPEDLNISQLISMIPEDSEVIFAFNFGVDGETTAMYISKLLEHKKVKISKLANGIPVGGMLEYIDQNTLSRAFEERRVIQERKI